MNSEPTYHKRNFHGGVTDEMWTLGDGAYHRLDGPAFISSTDGVVDYQSYWVNGKRHREDGPAIWYNPEGRLSKRPSRWYLDDVQLTQEEFEARMNPQPALEYEL